MYHESNLKDWWHQNFFLRSNSVGSLKNLLQCEFSIFPCFMPILFILVCQAHFRLWKAWMILVFKSFIRCCHLFIAKLNRWVSDAWLNFLLENQIWEFESQRKCSIKSWSCEQVRFSWRNVNQLHGESSFNESRFSYIENFGNSSENKITWKSVATKR